MQRRAAADLARLAGERFAAQALACDHVRTFATPRRLAVAAHVPRKQADSVEERRGPRVGAPARAVEGFLRAAGLESLAQCETRETPKGDFYFAVRERAGRATADLLPDIVQSIVAAMPWPKSMRWGSTRLRWVRPLHGVLCLFDGAAVPGVLSLGEDVDPLRFSDTTVGHRWLARGPLAVSSVDDYLAGLEAAHVVCDSGERARRIVAGGRALAAEAGLRFDPEPALLEEVAGLVEWPVPVLGTVDDAFMAVPPEVLTTAMTSHQKYFPLFTGEGALANRFVAVANIAAPDGGAAIRRGNERVLRARLHDARFFWEQDRSATLESRLVRLDGIVFHARLGSVGDKMRRLEKLAATVAGFVPGAGVDETTRAARLCKADLVTGMVGEFPELQGVMGRYYADHDGETAAVADAIAEHYAPAGAGDACPTAPVSVALALADRLDSLAGFFMIDERPTGSKDPFALRRAALGVVRLVLERGLRVPLRAAFEAAAAGHGADDPWAVADAALVFVAERLRVHMRGGGLRHDVVSAAFAVAGDDDLVRLRHRADALAAFLDTDDGANLLHAFRRARNIVRIEEKKDGSRHDGTVDLRTLAEPAERALHRSLGTAREQIDAALADERYDGAMRALAALRAPVDRFFDDVTVNVDAPDLRANRLRLLSQIGASLSAVADFSKIEGS